MQTIAPRNCRMYKPIAVFTQLFVLAIPLLFLGCGKDSQVNQTDENGESVQQTSEQKRTWPQGSELADGYWPNDEKFWGKGLAEWAELLSSGNRQREQAALVLGCYGEAAMPFVLSLLSQDDNRAGQREAIRAAFYLGPLAKDARPDLIRILKGDQCSGVYRDFALATLNATGGIPEELRAMAGKGLSHLQWQYDKDATSLAIVEDLLLPPPAYSDGWRLKDDELAKLDEHRDFIVPRLLKILQGDEASRRPGAARALGKIKAESAREVLVALAASEKSDMRLRLASIEALGELGNLQPETVEVLRKLLHRNEPCRRAVLFALGSSAKTTLAALPDVIDLIRSPPPYEDLRNLSNLPIRHLNLSAGEVLANYGRGAVPALLPLLKDESPEVRRSALGALSRMQEEAANAVDAIAECIDPSNQQVTQAALSALVEIGRPALPALLKAFRHPSPEVRKFAVFTGLIVALYWDYRPNQRASVLPVLQELARDDVPDVRFPAALNCLLLGGDAQKLLPTLTEGLETRPDYGDAIGDVVLRMRPHVAREADEVIPLLIKYRNSAGQPTQTSLLAIGKIGGPKAKAAVPWLREVLKDESLKHVHEPAAHTLMMVAGHPDAIPVLFPPNRLGNSSVEWTLATAGPVATKALPNLRRWINDYGDLRNAWALLSVSEEREAVAIIALALRIWSRPVFTSNFDENVLMILARLEGSAPAWFEEVLVSALASGMQEKRIAAAQALGELGCTERAVPILVAELEKDWARWEALRALNEIGSSAQAAIPAVEKLLNSPSSDSRRQARRTLQSLRNAKD